MSEKLQPPYSGQGLTVPASMGKGVWICENILFLDIETADQGTEERFDLGALVQTPAGNNAVRFIAATVASAMGLKVRDVIRANRAGKLLIEITAIKPRPGDEKAMHFKLSIGNRAFNLSMGMSRPPGIGNA